MNPNLSIEGILFVNVDSRTNYSKEMKELLMNSYSDEVHFFKDSIPHAVKVSECAALGVSLFSYAPNIKAAEAYESLAKEVDANE